MGVLVRSELTLFEDSARVPLIVWAPGMRATGKPCLRLVELIDLYPTLTDWCGLATPPGLDGTSFAALLNNPDRPWKPAAYSLIARSKDDSKHAREMDYLGRSVRSERWRYTEWDDGRQGAELYDYVMDPGEFYNLATDPHAADALWDMKLQLRNEFRPAAGR